MHATPWIYSFDHLHDVEPRSLRDLLGGKGANLAEMTSVLGLPVPAGFTVTTEACREHHLRGWPDDLDRSSTTPWPRSRRRSDGGWVTRPTPCCCR
ncbi:MAG: PEP/pyruvate-binding domain-containing protein [Actinomycetota bacterium]